MITAQEFLSLLEATKKSTALSSSLSSDDKGKIHELLLAKHLNGGNLPEHHRAVSDNPDHSGTPQQVHDKLKAKIGEHAYKEIDDHAKKSADAFHEHAKKTGIIPKGGKIHAVHWTSNRDTEKSVGDHEKTTGKKDVNSNADLILTVHHKDGNKSFHGISAKYGTRDKPKYKNSGIDSLEKVAGVKQGTFKSEVKKHEDRAEKMGYKGTSLARHKQHKEDLASGDKKRLARVDSAMKSSNEARTNIAKGLAKGLSKKSDAELREHIRAHVSAPTVHAHSIVHTHVQTDGSSKPVIHNSSHVADEHLDKFHSLSVHHSGISVAIKGTNKKTGKEQIVARHTIKAGSGPHKGVAGTFSL